jgi:hypothetical protein
VAATIGSKGAAPLSARQRILQVQGKGTLTSVRLVWRTDLSTESQQTECTLHQLLVSDEVYAEFQRSVGSAPIKM